MFEKFNGTIIKAAIKAAVRGTRYPGMTAQWLIDAKDWLDEEENFDFLLEQLEIWKEYKEPIRPIDVEPQPVFPDHPKHFVLDASGVEELRGHQVAMYYLDGRPRDYGSSMHVLFGNKHIFVKETRDMQPFGNGAKYRPEEKGRGAEGPGIKIFAPPGYSGPIEIYHN